MPSESRGQWNACAGPACEPSRHAVSALERPDVATHHAISAVGQGIVTLLKAASSTGELGALDVKLFHARDFQKGVEQGVSIYLYRVAISTARRNLQCPVAPSGRPYRPPLPLDLFYLITPWARTPELQHVILGWSLRTIDDSPSLPAGLLNAHLPGTFAEDDTVELVHEPSSLQDLVNIWEVGKANIQVSSTFVVRMVPIHSKVEMTGTGARVQTRVFATGQDGRR
jgi:hypothetical protein